jgi:hypothetical protein
MAAAFGAATHPLEAAAPEMTTTAPMDAAAAVQLWASYPEIAASTDVARLEQIATSFGYSPSETEPGRWEGTPKRQRTIAYARLGEIGTPESLAAVARIEAFGRAVSPTPDSFEMGLLMHPMWHFGPELCRAMAEVDAGDGRRWAVFESSMLGGRAIFLVSSATPEDRVSWTRPKLIPLSVYRGMKDVELEDLGGGELQLRFVQGPPPPRRVMEGTTDPGPEPPEEGPQQRTLVIEEILRDSDGDGWTDFEEQRLRLDPLNPDTDGDGVVDGDDVTPHHASPQGPPAAEERILQRAVFSSIGLSGARHALFVRDEAQRIDVWGYRGPILYGIDRGYWGGLGYGSIFVKWAITEMDAERAVVEISDYEGPLAAGTQKIELRRIRGDWYVVAWRPVSVS